MREIKFQVWWNGRMYTPNYLHFSPEGKLFGVLIKDGVFCAIHEVELREYTGLKDCKGKEIYEGDVVSGVRADGSVVEAWKGIVKFGKVDIGSNGFEYNCWINGFYAEAINDGSPSEYLTEDMIEGNIIIIGNIYEHPELAVREPDD